MNKQALYSDLKTKRSNSTYLLIIFYDGWLTVVIIAKC